ncbi:MAG TPA: dihydrofolate reductase family protein [Rhizomicrobium sp.]|jgi:dihydrofolate reductase|nr:dihydrofolate reductase family protein [Rhizomicrobium sp.]
MRKLVLKMSMSLDGFVCGPNNEMDWMFSSSGRNSGEWTVEFLRQAGLHIMGARTFKDMAAWWPHSDEIFAPVMNEIPKAVFSRAGLSHVATTEALQDAQRHRPLKGVVSPHARTWKEAEVVTGELAAEINRLKQQDGKFIVAHGGASFAQSLVTTGLIDEYRLLIHPVAIGVGKPLFGKLAAPLRLKLQETRSFGNGVVALIHLASQEERS